MIKAAVFDMDGSMIDSQPYWQTAQLEILPNVDDIEPVFSPRLFMGVLAFPSDGLLMEARWLPDDCGMVRHTGVVADAQIAVAPTRGHRVNMIGWTGQADRRTLEVKDSQYEQERLEADYHRCRNPRLQ
jgi:hypothetical protein